MSSIDKLQSNHYNKTKKQKVLRTRKQPLPSIQQQRQASTDGRKYYCILLILVAVVLIQTYSQIDIVLNPNFTIENNKNTSHVVNKSCLNHIYDEIFIISSPNRHKTLSVSLFQLNRENIIYTLWECHWFSNPYSMQLFHKNRFKINTSNDSFVRKHQFDIGSSVYRNTPQFFLRQTQIDIIKYARDQNHSKILLFEDDILLADPEWFDMFCAVESDIPFYYYLNIGQNHRGATVYRGNANGLLLNIPNHENKTMKYWLKTGRSFGVFGVAISKEMFPMLIDLFDVYGSSSSNIHASTYPVDNYMFFVPKEVFNHTYNIHPNLILPDVTTSSMRMNRHQGWFLHLHTTDGDKSHYMKYWNLRFSDNKTLTSNIQDDIAGFSLSFDEIMKRQGKNPSYKCLHPN